MSDETNRVVENPDKRKPRRVPLSEAGQKRLQTPENLDTKNFHYHWFNDSPGRIAAAKRGGYKEVTAEDPLYTETGTAGERHSVVNNKGSGQRAVLMKIPIDLYNEDQEAKEARNRAVDDAISRQEFEGRSLESEHTYVPEGGGIKYTR